MEPCSSCLVIAVYSIRTVTFRRGRLCFANYVLGLLCARGEKIFYRMFFKKKFPNIFSEKKKVFVQKTVFSKKNSLPFQVGLSCTGLQTLEL